MVGYESSLQVLYVDQQHLKVSSGMNWEPMQWAGVCVIGSHFFVLVKSQCEGPGQPPHIKGNRESQTQVMEVGNRASKESGAKRAGFLFYKKTNNKNTHIF